MPTVYLRYQDSDGQIVAIHTTEAASDNALETGQSTSAAYTLGDDDLLEPGWHYESTGGTTQFLPFYSRSDRETEWLRRTKRTYQTGMQNIRDWWPRESNVAATRQRALDVINYEVPNWWYDTHRILAAMIKGRAFTTMTVAQIEACVAHIEGLLTVQHPTLPGDGIIEIWYLVGRSKSGNDLTTAIPGTDPVRLGTGYASRVANPYTDCFDETSGVLTPMTPDYSWTSFAIGTEPANWDPNRPT